MSYTYPINGTIMLAGVEEYHDSWDSLDMPYLPTNINIPVVCWQFNPTQVVKYLLAYLIIRLLSSNYPKSHQFATNIISNISCWTYVLTGDLDLMISYYWYDLILVLCVKDYLMIVHHIFTLYGISHCTWYVDHAKVVTMLKTMKTSDVLTHHYKITDALELEKKYPVGIYMYQIFTVSFTCIMWLVLRIFNTLTLFPFTSTKANILIPLFLAINFAWIFKLVALVSRLCSKVKMNLLD